MSRLPEGVHVILLLLLLPLLVFFWQLAGSSIV